MMTFSLRPAALVAALFLAFGGSAALALSPVAPTSGLDRAGMDPSVRAQDDLFNAMNGTWLKTTAIPADKPAWGTMLRMRELSDERVKAVIDELVARPQAAGSGARKVVDWYQAFNDTAAIDRAGLAPVLASLAPIEAIADRAAFGLYLARVQGLGSAPLRLDVGPDAKNPGINVVGVEQSGLGVPDRDYLLKDDARFVKAREAYARYLSVLLTQAGDAQAAAHAAEVIALETKIAQAQWSRVENRDPVKTYNPMTLAELSAAAPGLDWAAFARAAALPADARLIVSQPGYLKALSGLLQSEPLATWKLYAKVRRLDDIAGVAPAALRDAQFAWRGQALQGQQQERPRWQLALAAMNPVLGETLGEHYVARYFPPEAKRRMQGLVDHLMKAYAGSIDGLVWMSPVTKKAAHEKLAKYTTKIGYPERWRDVGALQVVAGDALGNVDRARRFLHDRDLARIGQPVDRSEWGMTPQTVNAYYNPSANEIVFPAAILQPPMFDLAADDAVNYGAIGAVIGHEISHGFDDEGSQFDGDGKLRDWWTADDRKAFDAITARLAAQYDAYEPIPGKHVNGKLTLGENIADLSGLQVAWKAWKLSLGGQPSPVIDGLTGEQRFFLGWSQGWRQKAREERTLQQLVSDPHSPARYRVEGAAVNHDGFHEAFGTKAGDGMYKAPADRIRLW